MSSKAVPPVVFLDPFVQHYEWGKKSSRDAEGRDACTIAALQAAAGQPVDAAKPYAELWMGYHPSGINHVLSPSEGRLPIDDFLQRHPYFATGGAAGAPSSDALPYLMKVLSVAKPLSIQVHPTKSMAEELHRTQPGVYKDPNHKPEMCLALTPFEAMCGFRPVTEVIAHLHKVPEMQAVVGPDCMARLAAMLAAGPPSSAALRLIFESVMRADQALVHLQVSRLAARLEAAQQADRAAFDADPLAPVYRLAVRLNRDYPGDVGVLSALMLQHLSVPPGSAFFIGANTLHAYLSGDCVECMANSDNVIRGGLTPKFKDVELLCKILDYEQVGAQVLHAVPLPLLAACADKARFLSLPLGAPPGQLEGHKTISTAADTPLSVLARHFPASSDAGSLPHSADRSPVSSLPPHPGGSPSGSPGPRERMELGATEQCLQDLVRSARRNSSEAGGAACGSSNSGRDSRTDRSTSAQSGAPASSLSVFPVPVPEFRLFTLRLRGDEARGQEPPSPSRSGGGVLESRTFSENFPTVGLVLEGSGTLSVRSAVPGGGVAESGEAALHKGAVVMCCAGAQVSVSAGSGGLQMVLCSAQDLAAREKH